ncbi:nickel-dependent hydrogenase large subunit [Anaeromyxobacter diazotrophicus]|uniref:HupV protein n=1 Tax=Anaeromyxobacter diazotrophicus TaxID=2590199 RepID=A0A7I9VGL9_9BACT|nr:nickel-dependent hydrogenase large subunit [Anaeromyxobacter diazotrophicus]GEJ55288.1 HupV protein [Anaeromyxobacter diazotrophicus]
MKRVVVGPFNRVEGDLEVTLDVEGGAVRAARVCSPMYRGFEQLLAGKTPLDALTIVPRVCGICSVAQSAAAARALASAMGLEAPANGRLASDLVRAAESAADHLTHFYLFFMPDFAREAYARRPWFDAVQARFQAVRGSAAAEALEARARLLDLMGLLAGKWPHTLALQPGGTSRAVLPHEKLQLLLTLRAFRAFLERTLYGDALERVAALDDAAALAAWRDARPAGASDFAAFLRVADDLGLERYGRAHDAFMSVGAYGPDGAPWLAPGVYDGALHPLDPASIDEDVSHAWLADDVPRHPAQGVTRPAPDKPGAYTWCKAPRLGGRVVEVGALARQVVAGHPLARDLVARGGGNVLSRVAGRLLELARLVPEMERWVAALAPGEPFCADGALPDEASGVGLVEAARGGLGHWLEVRGGRIHGYQIIAPTTWNFSPRDAGGQPGPLEQALTGLPVGDGEAAVLVQHVVRSFDPCMVCTVH